MRKCLICLLVLILTFTGCTYDNNENLDLTSKEKATQTPMANHTNSPHKELPQPIASKEPQLPNKEDNSGLTQVSKKNSEVGCSTENGYYYISYDKDSNNDKFYNLCYVDYDKQEENYLCNDTNCSHLNNSCSSCLNQEIGEGRAVLFTNQKKVYLLVNTTEQDGTVSTNTKDPSSTPATLYSMDLDGSNRTLVHTFPAGQTIDENIFYDGENFLMMIEENTSLPIPTDETRPYDEPETYTKATRKELISLSPDNYEPTKITDIDSTLQVVGCSQIHLVLVQEQIDSKYNIEDITHSSDRYYKALKTQQISFFRLNPKTKDQAQVMELTGTGLKSYVVTNNSIYYGIEKSGEIKKVNIETCQTETVGKSNYCCIISYTNDALILKYFCMGTNGNTHIMYLEDGSSIDYPKEMLGEIPSDIVASTSNHFLIQRGINFQDYDDLDDAEYSKVDLDDRKLLLISKSDLLTQISNFKEIKKSSHGEIASFAYTGGSKG